MCASCDDLGISDDEAMLWVVAGCLFEISLPVTTAGRWRWTNARSEVTLLAEDVREGRQHLRFRAEAAGAKARVVELQFGHDEAEDRHPAVCVRIAPEQLDRRA